MAKFTDAEGREWDLRITLGLLPRLRAAGLNLSLAAKDPDEFKALDDPETLGRVLWTFCESQAAARGVDHESFAAGFDGPAVHAFYGALEVALVDFTLPPAAAARARERLPAVRARAEAEMAAAVDRTLSASNGTGGNSPGSPGSTAGT